MSSLTATQLPIEPADNAGSVSIVRLPARLLMTNASTLRRQIEAHVEAGRNRLVLDLTDVEMLDSSGLSVLITALRRARSSGGDVVLTGLNDDVRSLIELTRMHLLFAIFDDRAAAADSLA